MSRFKLIPVSKEDYDALHITEYTALESYINSAGELVIRPLRDLDDYTCDGDCARCPLSGAGGDGKVTPIGKGRKKT